MLVTGIKTDKIRAGEVSLAAILDSAISKLKEGSIVAITSKVVALCENSVVSFDEIDKEELIKQESDLYLPAKISKYGHHFTITNNTLIPVAGIDESNGDGKYVLWPKDAQKTANQVRVYLAERFGLKEVGVVITDSTCRPLRRGTGGIALAHSGFAALHNYVGKPDLFGKPFSVSQADITGGVAAAAVLQMGEGAEQTPIAVVSDVPFITFQDRDPSDEELSELNIPLEEDLFEPFLANVSWQQGGRKQQ